MNCSRGQSRAARWRTGGAVVELAICLPLIILLVFAALEGANMLFLRQAAVQACYEAAKEAAKSNGSEANARQLAQQILDARRATNATIRFTPANTDNLPEGRPFTVSVEVPGASRSITGIGPFQGIIVSADATMQKE